MVNIQGLDKNLLSANTKGSAVQTGVKANDVKEIKKEIKENANQGRNKNAASVSSNLPSQK